jgi:hypothetical protein
VAGPLRRMIDGQPGMLIHPDMRVTRKGMQGAYKFRRMQIAGEDRYENQPVKNANSHPCEAGQYMALGMGEGQQQLRPNTEASQASAASYRDVRGLAAPPAPEPRGAMVPATAPAAPANRTSASRYRQKRRLPR